MRVYAIGDIHGQLDMLRAAHSFITKDRAACGDSTAPVIHLGDYCDRGPDTAGVIQFLCDELADGQPWRTVLGNHDRLFLNFVRDQRVTDNRLREDLTWLSPGMGGMDTLRSYGLDATNPLRIDDLHADAKHRVPETHLQFLAGLETFVELEDLVCVHAGIRPGLPMAEQVEDDLIWIRQEFLNDTRDHGKLVVHGHTPVDVPMHCGNRVNLDTGAGYFQPLTVAVFEGRDSWVVTPDGRKPLLPQPQPMF